MAYDDEHLPNRSVKVDESSRAGGPPGPSAPAGRAAGSTPLLEITGMSKWFPGNLALDDVSLSVGAGEILALVGQNGSGKSTLIKVLAGFHDADGGDISVTLSDGEVYEGAKARPHLHFIHQDLGLVPTLSMIENLDLDRKSSWRDLLPSRTSDEVAAAQELLREFGTMFDVRAPIASLAPAERTIVAIVRAITGWTDPNSVLVLDEPTSSLNRTEVDRLFRAVRAVAARGAAIIFVSHRLDEVMDLADRVVVLRDGRKVADVERGGFDHDDLVRMIAGRELANFQHEAHAQDEAVPLIEIRGLRGHTVEDLTVGLRAGEVVGLGGLLGSGRDDVARLIYGGLPREQGEILIEGRVVTPKGPREAIAAGMGLVPADRAADGLVMTMTVAENLVLPHMSRLRTPAGNIKVSREKAETAKWIASTELRPQRAAAVVRLLSGGNQQKVVLAKWLRAEPKLLLLEEPTQGVDIGAKTMIYELIASAAQSGAAVLVSSSDAKELVQICDRVLVFRDGVVAASLSGAQLTEANIIQQSLRVFTPALDKGEADAG